MGIFTRRATAIVAVATINPVSDAVPTMRPAQKPKEILTIEKVPAVASLNLTELEEYRQVCEELGYKPADLLAEKVLQFCAANAIEVYPIEKVQAYMNKRFGRETSRDYAGWGWWPMRAREVTFVVNTAHWNLSRVYGGGRLDSPLDQPYTEKIPLPVLLTAQKIEQGVPGIIGFAVAAKCDRRVKGDPFLGVLVHQDVPPIVVERWDEPAFR